MKTAMSCESLQYRRQGPHRAMMLVEVSVAVALLTVVMGIVVSLLISLRQWDRRLRDGSERADQVLRLAQTLRADVRLGTNVSLSADSTLLISSAGNSETRYELVAEGCTRTTAAADQAAARELFSIGPAASWSIENGPVGRHPMVIVTLKRSADSTDSKSDGIPLLVSAALGADLPMKERTP